MTEFSQTSNYCSLDDRILAVIKENYKTAREICKEIGYSDGANQVTSALKSLRKYNLVQFKILEERKYGLKPLAYKAK